MSLEAPIHGGRLQSAKPPLNFAVLPILPKITKALGGRGEEGLNMVAANF